jgi:phage tail sheath protein FI
MPNFVSPGVYVIEKDISEYPANINSSVVGIVGFASKGPTNKATLSTSTNQLIDTFGKPSEALYGQGLEGAVEILETTSQVYFIRAADDAIAADASAQVSLGGSPTVFVSAGADPTHGATAAAGLHKRWGLDDALTLRVNIYGAQGVKKTVGNGKDVVIPSGTIDPTDASASLGRAIRKATGGDNDNASFGAYASSLASDTSTVGIVSHFAGSGAYMTIEACSGTSYNKASGTFCLLGQDHKTGDLSSFVQAANIDVDDASSLASSIKVWGSEFLSTGANSISYLAESLYPGAGYNAGTTVAGDTSGNSVEITTLGGPFALLTVNDLGAATENFKVGYISGANFVETQIQEGETDLKSRVIKGNTVSGVGDDLDPTGGADYSDKLSTLMGLVSNNTGITGSYKVTVRVHDESSADVDTTVGTVADLDGRHVKFLEGTYNMTGGNNGIPTDDEDKASVLIGDSTLEPKTGMQALDNDLLNISIALVPGVSLESVQNNLITLAETSQNFIAVVSPPYAIGTTQDAVDWHNGLTTSRGASIDNSYAAIYWPWVQMFSVFDRKDLWMDPAVYGVRQMAFNDSVGEVWFAPAGYQRGRLSKPIDVEVDLNRGDINTLYSGGNRVNPIVNFPQQGITVWGQRTAQSAPTALDRINIRRMLIYIRKIILQSTRRFVFEPNDLFLWSQIENVLNPFLDDIANRRGITEFRVVCDETTNTPVRVDRNELWCKVLIKPTKTAEILIFELNLTSQSADLGKL